MQYVFVKDDKGNLRDQNNIVFLNQPNFFNYQQIKKPMVKSIIKTKKNKKTSLSSLLRKNTFKVIYSNS